MPLFNSQHHSGRGMRWLGTAATVVVELLVVVALGVAVVRYLEWSSDANQAEFMSATKPSASVANHSGEFFYSGDVSAIIRHGAAPFCGRTPCT